jgi:Putative addiction module component
MASRIEVTIYCQDDINEEDIAICEQRLAELDAGHTTVVSWEDVSRRVFGTA